MTFLNFFNPFLGLCNHPKRSSCRLDFSSIRYRCAMVIMALVAAGALVRVEPASAAEQCVHKDAAYNSIVRWYAPGSLTIDNSEPWNNRVLLQRTSKNNKGASGIDVSTGERVWQGVHIKPVREENLNVRNPKVCMPGSSGDHVAIVHCRGCAQGVNFLKGAADLLAGSTLNLVTAPMAIGGLIDSAMSLAGTQGISPEAAMGKVLAQSKSAFKLGTKLTGRVPIHDISDLPDTGNLIYFGTPQNLIVKGRITGPYAMEASKVSAEYPALSYQVKIDCKHFHPDITNTGTQNTITANFFTGGRLVHSTVKNGQDINCGVAWDVLSTPRLYDRTTGKALPAIDRVELSTNGQDGFFIDQLEIRALAGGGATQSRDLSPFAFRNNGKSDNKCLSTDAMDGSRTWKNHIPGQRCENPIKLKLKDF